MTALAIIGGTGLTTLKNLVITGRQILATPYGEPSGPLIFGTLGGQEVVFLARHGAQHTIPPHRVNYRANLWALKNIGAQHIIALAAVGGITPALAPGRLAFPEQIVDYTWGRVHTFFEDGGSPVAHIDFTDPYCAGLRATLLQAAATAALDYHPGGVYAATQGPRLETRAEIDRLERDGCDMVGMTGMPEAALARELELCYAACALVVNWAAGRGGGVITMQDIEHHLAVAREQVLRLLEHTLGAF